MHEPLIQRLRDTAQMRDVLPDWLLDELTKAADALEAMSSQPVALLDIEAARRERDEAREARERAELDLAYLANEMVYDGNSVGWIASKADKYKRALLEAWDAVKAVGGKCDGNTALATAIRAQLAAAPSPPVALVCTCPSGDGSLRWPCPKHPPSPPSPPALPANTRTVTVSHDGVQFGPYCFISHEQITGHAASVLNEAAEGRGGVIAMQYMRWLNTATPLQSMTLSDGFAVTPREPTQEMVKAGTILGDSPNKVSFIYQSMINAAPGVDALPADTLCRTCGQPTMHIGTTCYACSHAAPEVPDGK